MIDHHSTKLKPEKNSALKGKPEFFSGFNFTTA